MARDHYNTEWTIDELLASVLKEIRILEAWAHTLKHLSKSFANHKLLLCSYQQAPSDS